MALSPSLPAWYLQHVAPGTWVPLRPVEPVLKAHNDVAAVSCDILPFWPQRSCCVPKAGGDGADGVAVPTLDALI